MSSISGKQGVSFRYKQINRQRTTMKSTAKEFQDYQDEQYIDFSPTKYTNK